MTPQDLRNLKRAELIELAEEHSVPGATVLTRVELVDEIVKRTEPLSQQRGIRGWLGRARDLVAQVVARGLHLPEAAKLLRSQPPPRMPKPPPPLPTVTLAEIYEAQGHSDKAIAVLDEVLERSPDNTLATTLRNKLAGPASDPEPATQPEPATEREPPRTEPFPGAYNRDEVVALATDPNTAYVYWEVRPARFARLRATDPKGQLVLRALAVSSDTDGKVVSRTWDIDIDALVSDAFIRGLEPSSELRLCVAWRGPRGFVPIAVAPHAQMPGDQSLGASDCVEQRVNTVENVRSRFAAIKGQTPDAAHPMMKRFAALADGALTGGPPARTIAVLLGSNADGASDGASAALHATLLAQRGSGGSSELHSNT